MTQLVPFESGKVPAHLRAAGLISNLAPSGGGGGFPTISIKGKVFHIKRGDQKELISQPNDPDTPASAIEVVIIDAGPAAGKNAKVYYEEGYTEGSEAKPTCYSNDGEKPATDAAEAQAKKCAVCAHNVWGTGQGGKGTRCASSKRLAIATPGAINDAMLLRVPAGSLGALGEYARLLDKRGVAPQAVVTKIGFDYSVAHPALTFKPVGFLDADTFEAVMGAMQDDTVKQITGMVAAVDANEFEADPVPAKKAEIPKVEAPKPTPKPAPKPTPQVEEDDELPAAPKAKVKVEGEEAAAKPAKKAASKVETADEGLDAALDDLDFDM